MVRLFSPYAITALTWALEIGDVSRLHSVKQAISYCGLCGDEKSSAEKMLRTPLSKQRNKHIQHVLVEAAKLAPKQSHELALVYERAKEKGNVNRATIYLVQSVHAHSNFLRVTAHIFVSDVRNCVALT